MTSIAERIRAERLRLGYSQVGFAQLTGATKSAQVLWEKGGAFPNAKALASWAAVGADVNFIVTGVHSAGPALNSDFPLDAIDTVADLLVGLGKLLKQGDRHVLATALRALGK